MKIINNIKENPLIKKIIFNNLLKEIKVYIKRKIYNLIKANMEKKQKSINEIKKKIIYKNIIILINYIIQFLSIIYKFLVKLKTIFLLSKLLLIYLIKSEINLQLFKMQIRIFKDNIINK